MNTVIIKTYQDISLREKEILRYAGCKAADPQTRELLRECLEETQGALAYRVCYCHLPVRVTDGTCDFGLLKIKSNDLAANLSGCENAVLFAATVGMGLDRLIAKHSRLSPSKALMMQAIGAEGVETLCDRFSQDIAVQTGATLKPRFSAGYGDLPLSAQKEIFSVLDCGRHIGLTLNDSLIMSPSKSVTAFIGLK